VWNIGFSWLKQGISVLKTQKAQETQETQYGL
jgi:hypothetical protein